MNRPSVIEYYKELIDVNDELVSQISTGSTVSPNRIRSRVICISFHEVQLICEAINKQRDQIIPICPEAVNLTDKLFYNIHSTNSIIGFYSITEKIKYSWIKLTPIQAENSGHLNLS